MTEQIKETRKHVATKKTIADALGELQKQVSLNYSEQEFFLVSLKKELEDITAAFKKLRKNQRMLEIILIVNLFISLILNLLK